MQDSSQASSPETASPDVVPTALPNGRQSDPVTEAATPDRVPAAEQQQDDPGTATSTTGPATTTPTLPQLDTSAGLPTSHSTSASLPAPAEQGNNLQQLAQMIIRDKETGKEYMIADLGGDAEHLSSQKLINLSTNETLVLQYDTLDPEHGSTTARSNARSASSSHALASDAPGTASARGTPRDHPGDDTFPGGAAPASPTGAKAKGKSVKAWAAGKARKWCASCAPLLTSALKSSMRASATVFACDKHAHTVYSIVTLGYTCCS